MAFLELKNLTVEFSGFRAVNEVNLSVEKGEIRVLIGPNGAGKTTILDMITGKTRPTYGAVLINGENIVGKSPNIIASRYKVGRKFQGPNVFDNMTVYENIDVSLKGFNQISRNFTCRHTVAMRERINEILREINLEKEKDMVTTSLSHGQRQWLEIGMVLAQDPELIVLDEPTAGMTADETYKTGEMIKTVMKGKTVVVIEHDIDFVKQIAQTITVLNQGSILAEGTYDEITTNPEVVRVYLKNDEKEA